MIRKIGLVLLIGTFVAALGTPPASATTMPVRGSATGTGDIYGPSGTSFAGTWTFTLGNGPLAGSTVTAVYTVDFSFPGNIDTVAPNSVTITSHGGTLSGVVSDAQPGSCENGCPGQGGILVGATVTIHVTDGTGRFSRITGGDLVITTTNTFLDNGFSAHFQESAAGTISGSLTS